MKELNIFHDKILVIYAWELVETTESAISDEDGEDGQDSEVPSESDECDRSDRLHTVTFKCIGATRDSSHQLALHAALQNIRAGQYVPVRFNPEPDNPVDSTAIAFQCFVQEEWQRMGYIVQEALPYVHDAMRDNAILLVELGWVRYLLCWSRCGPGFYAGIKISKQGDWSRTVVRAASTK